MTRFQVMASMPSRIGDRDYQTGQIVATIETELSVAELANWLPYGRKIVVELEPEQTLAVPELAPEHPKAPVPSMEKVGTSEPEAVSVPTKTLQTVGLSDAILRFLKMAGIETIEQAKEYQAANGSFEPLKHIGKKMSDEIIEAIK